MTDPGLYVMTPTGLRVAATVPGPEGPVGPEGPQGVPGTDGADGAPGADSTVPGPPGADGVGIPAGGSIGQVLKKNSATDYDTTWGSGSGGGVRYWSNPTGSAPVDPTPLYDTLIPGMQLTIPTAAFERIAFVSTALLWSGSHPNRMTLYLNGDIVPIGGSSALPHGYSSGDSQLFAETANLPVILPADVEHTLDVRWNAMGSTSGVTVIRRAMIVDVYPSDGATANSGSVAM